MPPPLKGLHELGPPWEHPSAGFPNKSCAEGSDCPLHPPFQTAEFLPENSNRRKLQVLAFGQACGPRLQARHTAEGVLRGLLMDSPTQPHHPRVPPQRARKFPIQTRTSRCTHQYKPLHQGTRGAHLQALSTAGPQNQVRGGAPAHPGHCASFRAVRLIPAPRAQRAQGHLG